MCVSVWLFAHNLLAENPISLAVCFHVASLQLPSDDSRHSLQNFMKKEGKNSIRSSSNLQAGQAG